MYSAVCTVLYVQYCMYIECCMYSAVCTVLYVECSVASLAGHTPYPDVHLGPSFEALITYLKEGNRMGQPDGCSPEL